jgi:arylsulfatase A-like enzyme
VRRGALRPLLIAAVAGSILAGLAAPAPATAAQRPNVVVIQTDDQKLSDLYATQTGPDGLPQAAMPNTLSLIGAAGATFSRYYASDPLCCPSRASLLTGQYAHNDGVLGNGPGALGGYGALDKANNLAPWLQDAGYRTIHIGKFLNYYGQPPVSAPTEIPPGWSDWETLAGEDSTHYFYGYRLNVNGSVQGPFGDITYAQKDSPGCLPDSAAGSCDYQTDVLTRRAVGQIQASAGNGPFFLSLDYVAPHGDFRAPFGPEPAPRDYDTWASTPYPRPKGFDEADVSDKPPFLRSASPLSRVAIGQIQQEWQKRIESLRAVDAGVGRVIDALAATGQLANTYVFFTSDNGFFGGEHRIQREKFLPYEPSSHLPLLLRGPGISPGVRSGELTMNVDLAPTILSIAGASATVPIDGRSLLPFARKPAKRTRRPLLLEGFTKAVEVATAKPIFNAPVRDFQGVKVGPYKYVRYAGGVRELYDLRDDPAELHSRVSDPRYRLVRAYLSKRLNRLRRCAGPACRRPLRAKIPNPLPPEPRRGKPGGA